jgi:tetratricopeptide (TPR) repeat protein
MADLGPRNRFVAEKAAATWREKLDFFQAELALTADPDMKFQLKKGIEEARAKIGELGGNPDVPRETSPTRPPRLPKAPRCFGREREVEALVAAFCAEPPPPIPLLGGPGMGKSTISLKALDDVRVIGKFGPRRYFVRCEAAETEEAVLRALASGVGLDLQAGGDLAERAFLELERAPAALVLDNLETPWWAHPEPVEELLAKLAGVPGLAFAASLRGGRLPVRIEWGEEIEVDVLPPDAARQTFVAIAKKHQVGDPELDGLLEAVDRVALAVELLAHQAQDEPTLASLRRRWEALRTEMLRIEGGEKRTANFGASLELSVQSLRSPGAKQLLALLGVLPDGIADGDVAVLVADPDAAAALRRVGLLARRDESRIQVLAPVREHAARRHPPEPEHLARATAFYLEMAGRGNQVGRKGGASAVARLSMELNNLEVMITQELDNAKPEPAIDATIALGELYRFTGLGGPRLLEQAWKVARAVGNVEDEARCLLHLGLVAFDRFDYTEARGRVEHAQSLYQSIGSMLGQASCIKKLGDIALSCIDYVEAHNCFERALPLFKRNESPLGEAHCIESLGDIALRRSDHAEAQSRYEQALSRYQHAGDLLGEANCTQSLGNIALRHSDHAEAQRHYEQALHLYQQVGDLLGEANCMQGLGDIALLRSDHTQARRRYEQARPVYQRLGSSHGEAVCIARLGDVALARSEHAEARRCYEQALLLFRRLESMPGEANCLKGLGDVALDRFEHVEAHSQYEQALPLYQRIEDLLGEANCIKGLGDIALYRSEHDEAYSRYEQALPLFQRVGDLRGGANCMKGLGDVALARSEHDEARSRYEQALSLYQRVGERLGEANCILGLGNIALRCSEHDEARSRYEQALALFQRLGALLGEANCLLNLGKMAEARVEARRLAGEALALFGRIPEPYSMAHAHVVLARLADESTERRRHVASARDLLKRLDRLEMVEELRREFGEDAAEEGGLATSAADSDLP